MKPLDDEIGKDMEKLISYLAAISVVVCELELANYAIEWQMLHDIKGVRA